MRGFPRRRWWHLPIAVAFFHQRGIAQSRTIGTRGVYAPDAVEDVRLGPDETRGCGAHVVDFEAFVGSDGLLQHHGGVSRAQRKQRHLGQRLAGVGGQEACGQIVVVRPDERAVRQLVIPHLVHERRWIFRLDERVGELVGRRRRPASSGTLSTTRLSSGSFFVCSITTDAPPPTAAKAPTPNAPYRKWRRVSRTSPPFGVGTRTPLPPALPLEVPRGAGDDGEGDAEDERRCAPTEPMALALPYPATLPTSAEPPRRPLPPCAPPYPATFPTCPPRAFGFPPAYSAPPGRLRACSRDVS